MTYAQLTMVLLAQRSEDDEAKPLPARYWKDRQKMILAAMQEASRNGTS